MKSVYFAFVFLLLSGCASGPRLDTSHPSVNHDNRVQFVVVHYTSTNLERSLALLTHGQVSSHYLIDAAPATVPAPAEAPPASEAQPAASEPASAASTPGSAAAASDEDTRA